MFNPMDRTRTLTPVRAWVETAKAIAADNDLHLGNVFVHIASPLTVDEEEQAVVRRVDAFLREHDEYGVSTVANTIFPESLDRGDGVHALTERYLQVFNRVMKSSGWGRYFERLVRWPRREGDQPINQLACMVEMLTEARTGTFHTEKYEMVIGDPARDLRKIQGRPCLGLIELKPEKPNTLHMTATYRNHHYVRKTLGNMLGLASLQGFLARESGFEVGTLTLCSTSARLETVGGRWGKQAVRDLIADCDGLLTSRLAA